MMTYIEEMLSYINDIDDTIMEYELEVTNALVDSYQKALTIMENYNGDSITDFSIFQEGFILEADENDKSNFTFRQTDADGNKESIVKSVLYAIPRLIKFLIDCIKKKMNKNSVEKLENNVTAINDMTDGEKEICDNAIANASTTVNTNSQESSNNNNEVSFNKKEIIDIVHGIEKERRKSERIRKVGKFVAKTAAIAGAGAIAYNQRDNIANVTKKGVNKVKDKAVNAVSDKIQQVSNKITNTANDKIQQVGDKITNAVQPAVDALEKSAEKVQEAARICVNFAHKAIESIKRFIKTILNYIPGFKIKKDPSIINEEDINYNAARDQLTVPLSHSKLCNWIKQCNTFMKYVDRYVTTGAPYPNGIEFNKSFRDNAKAHLESATQNDCKYTLNDYVKSQKQLVMVLNTSLNTCENLLNTINQKASKSKSVIDSETAKDLQMICNIQTNLIQSCTCINQYVELVRDMSDDVKNAMVE